jgi:uncharacterized BrkB/YihY/UPF0761 family membrane protein
MFINRQADAKSFSSLLPMIGTLSGFLVGIYVVSDVLLNLGLDRFAAIESGDLLLTDAARIGVGLLVFTYLGLSLGMVANRWFQPQAKHR